MDIAIVVSGLNSIVLVALLYFYGRLAVRSKAPSPSVSSCLLYSSWPRTCSRSSRTGAWPRSLAHRPSPISLGSPRSSSWRCGAPAVHGLSYGRESVQSKKTASRGARVSRIPKGMTSRHAHPGVLHRLSSDHRTREACPSPVLSPDAGRPSSGYLPAQDLDAGGDGEVEVYPEIPDLAMYPVVAPQSSNPASSK